MLVAIRSSAGSAKGLGHVRRCLTLADELASRGSEVLFLVERSDYVERLLGTRTQLRPVFVSDGEASDLDRTRVELLRWRAQVTIVDNYDVAERALRALRAPVAVFVDAPPRTPLPVDLLINGAADPCGDHYPVLSRTRLLLGPQYVLLRREFVGMPTPSVRSSIGRILVTTGGSDTAGATLLLLDILREVFPAAAVNVIVGPYFRSQTVKQLRILVREDRRLTLHEDVVDTASLMQRCDLAVSGGGQTLFELAASGTPTIGVKLADNQAGNLNTLAARGATVDAGGVEEPGFRRRVRDAIRRLARDTAARQAMSRAARQAVDGLGARRIADAVHELSERW